MSAPGTGCDPEESGPLVFQRGKKLNEEYYIISVRDNAENACVKFAAYELESSETFELSYSYADFDALFKTNVELVNPSNKEGRYDWVVDRLDFACDNSGGAKRLTLASAPTADDDGTDAKSNQPRQQGPRERLTYADRQRLREQAEKLEEKRAANIALKSEKNRKQFVAELQEKRKLEELKGAARRQRIDEERAERREKTEMQRRIQEERQKRYEENEKKREERIHVLEGERKLRDSQKVKAILEVAAEKQNALRVKLTDARQRKQAESERLGQEVATAKEAQAEKDGKRDAKIAEREERLKTAEKQYLEWRLQKIAELEKEKTDKEDKKREYLKDRATQRAAQLREKHQKIEAWERLEDTRTQCNLKKEHARDNLMLEHIESLRAKHSHEQAASMARKQATLEERKDREVRQAEAVAVETKRLSELEQKRNRAIASREAEREQRNSKYCDQIRNMKTQDALRVRDQETLVANARVRSKEVRIEERKNCAEQENAAAIVNAQREQNIRKKELARDQNFAASIKDKKEHAKEKELAIESQKIQKKLAEKERAIKTHEEEQAKRRQLEVLEEQREAMIRERAYERNKREQERLKRSGGQDGRGGSAVGVATEASPVGGSNTDTAPA